MSILHDQKNDCCVISLKCNEIFTLFIPFHGENMKKTTTKLWQLFVNRQHMHHFIYTVSRWNYYLKLKCSTHIFFLVSENVRQRGELKQNITRFNFPH